MADRSLIETLTDALAEAVHSALDGADQTLPALPAPDAGAARADLATLQARAQDVTQASNPASWVSSLEQWRATLGNLADNAVGTAPGKHDALIVRFLQERLPRTAAMLMLAGVISSPPQGQPRVDWAKLRAFITEPQTLIDEELWDALLGDTGIPGSGRIPAVIAGLIILFPQTVHALARDGDLSVAPLLPPPAEPGPWRDYRDATGDWISVTVPFPDPARPEAERVPAGPADLVADLQPNLYATLGIRSHRRSVGGQSRTDFELWLALAVDRDRWDYVFTTGWFLRLEPAITFGFGTDGEWHGAFRPFSMANLSKPLGPDDPVTASIGRELPAGAPDLAFGPPYDTRLIVQDLAFFLKVRESHPVFELGFFVHGFAVVLTNRWFRSLGATNELFGEGIRFDMDLDLAFVEGQGVVLGLGAGLDVTFDLDWTPVGDRDPAKKGFDLTIHSVRVHVPIEATQDTFDIRAEVRFHASVRFKVVVLVIDGLGGWAGYWSEGEPPEKHYVGFLPPTGAGLELTLKGVTGGGFLDFTGGPNDHYAGLLHLKIGRVEVTAFGIHELTGSPAAANRRTSFIMVLGIRLEPGIQLGYGFSITGFGGLLGINRRCDTDALRERLTSGAAGNVLFAEDPVRNAPSILGDLDALFPPAEGVHVFGPTLQISWLRVFDKEFAHLDLGLFIELPGPSKIVLLGSLRAEIPGAEVLLHLRLDLVGFIDFHKEVIEFDATLINSTALAIFVLTGDAAFRSSYGDRPYAMLTIGGFHPHFNPEPAVFPKLTRVALTLKKPHKDLTLRFEAYLAVTTNSFQVGGQLEVCVHAGSVNAQGVVTLDALIQFTPFHFEIEVSGSFRVRWRSHNLAGVKLTGTISGPGPVVVTGKFCIELLFFDICWSDSFSLGGAAEAALAAVGSVVQALAGELAEARNLESTGGDDRHASQQPRGVPARVLVAPLGALTWTQKRVPFNLLIDRFEGQPLGTPQSLSISASTAGSAVHDWFSPGSFATLTEAERLNRPSFERLDAGVEIGLGEEAATPSVHTPTVIEIRLPAPPVIGGRFAFPAIVLDGVLARTAGAAVRTTAAKVVVADEQFVVRGGDGSIAASGRSASDAHARARLSGGVALPAEDLVEIAGV